MMEERSAVVSASSLAGVHFSTVIVGAGINGVGVFRDLCLQGVDCLVVDKGDFAAGASSAPSRMIHGGLRYLENGDFSLVAEATHERNLLLRNAPHLVRPLQTVVPLSSRLGGLLGSALRFVGIEAPPRSRGLLAVALGLRLYDLLGRRQRALPGHSISRVGLADAKLFRASVRWAATYFDAWISHPEWLIQELIDDAHRDEPRSLAANYCRVVRCSGNTLTLCDDITGEQVEITADVVVNASGAWLDQAAEALGGVGSRVMGTKGSHLVLDHPVLHAALDGRMAYFEASDGRVCIVYPFMDRVLVGSTDIPIANPDQAETEAGEIEYLLAVLSELFPRLTFDRDAVVYTFVGVRPLARSDADRPGQISRDHAVITDPPNLQRSIPLVCLVGGKWTTFRALAAQATDAVLRQIGQRRGQSTSHLPIGGGANWPADKQSMHELQADVARRTGLTLRRVAELFNRYGTKASALASLFSSCGDDPLQHAPEYSVAEIRYLCRHTGVRCLADIILRRTLLAIRGQITNPALAEIAGITASSLGWAPDRLAQELQACAGLLRQRHNVRLAVPDTPHAPNKICLNSPLPLDPIPRTVAT